jgi:AcrR family transcriptional regulator
LVPLQGRTEQDSREQRILDAAGELLLRFGYRRVTVEDVAARSGVGKGTVYLHWNAKQELFASLLLREVGDVMGQVVQGMRAGPAEVLLHRMMRASFLAIMRRPLALQAAGAGFYFMEQFLPPDPQLPLERKAAALAEIIRRAFEPSEDPDIETLCAIAPRAVELFDLMRTGGLPEASGPTDSVRE